MNRTNEFGGKKAGDKYNVPTAPEEFHYWTKEKGWKEEDLKKYGVKFVKVFFHGSSVQNIMKKEKFTKKSPRRFNNGEISHGTFSSVAKADLHFSMLISNISQTNKLLREICDIYNMTSLLIVSLEVQNLETNSVLFFKRFSPNHLGISLYIKTANGRSYIQEKYVSKKLGKFRGIEASCLLAERPKELYPTCAVNPK